jgi:hypothetical protein
VFFAVEEHPRVNVEIESGGDRIRLMVLNREASLHITMQLGVAAALHQVLVPAIGLGALEVQI